MGNRTMQRTVIMLAVLATSACTTKPHAGMIPSAQALVGPPTADEAQALLQQDFEASGQATSDANEIRTAIAALSTDVSVGVSFGSDLSCFAKGCSISVTAATSTAPSMQQSNVMALFKANWDGAVAVPRSSNNVYKVFLDECRYRLLPRLY